MTMPGGCVFEGTWKDGLLERPGPRHLPQRRRLRGRRSSTAGARARAGCSFAGGRVYEGLWEAGQPVAPVNAVLPAADAPPTEPAEAVE